VLEIGSGTGQHAAYFAPELPHLAWQANDIAENLPGIRLWGVEPIELDVDRPFPDVEVDGPRRAMRSSTRAEDNPMPANNRLLVFRKQTA
jgi:hypothetical protein